MRRAFTDAFYFLALLNPRDAAHKWATEFTDDFAGSLMTTAWVLTEVADGLAAQHQRGLFVELRQELAANGNIVVVSCSDELWRAACELYRARPDKEWSLTDCTSFIVMQRDGIREALTSDHHFEQAGFIPLLKP